MSEQYYYRKQVIELFDCDEAFLDELEAEALVHSIEAGTGGERVFSSDQVERIRIITNLVRDLEVNLPGCEVILEMRERLINMRSQFDQILAMLVTHFKKRSRES
jgi:DNA-binding transcriptional MerR regulator